MASLNPLFRAISVHVIHDRQRDCFLGTATDHWMVISLQQLRDLRLFETAAEAWNEIAGRPGLEVREVIIDLGPAAPLSTGTDEALHTSHRALQAVN